MNNPLRADVIVIGSGAGGAAVAGELGRSGLKVKVLEAGPVITTPAGTQVRNADSSDKAMAAAITYFEERYRPHNGAENFPASMPGLGAIHGVGGMFTSWSNNAPTHDVTELPAWLDQPAWQPLVERAKKLLHVSAAHGSNDPRLGLIAKHFGEAVGPLPADRAVQNMPIAASWDGQTLHFGGADDLLAGSAGSVEILPNRIVRRIDSKGSRVTSVTAWSTESNSVETYAADEIVLAGGTVGCAQLLAASGLDAGPALGAYLMEHVAIATRISLKPEFRCAEQVEGPTFAVWAPVSAQHPWHTQCTRHLMDYINVLPPDFDPCNTADLIAFCPIEPTAANRLTFELDRLDPYGLPSMTGRITLSDSDKLIASRALAEQFLVSQELGELDSGWAAKMIPRGGSTHMMGSCRMGAQDDGTSVVNPEGRLWRYDNLHVAGNAVLSTANAGNPSLTMVAFALHAADDILGRTTGQLIGPNSGVASLNRSGR